MTEIDPEPVRSYTARQPGFAYNFKNNKVNIQFNNPFLNTEMTTKDLENDMKNPLAPRRQSTGGTNNASASGGALNMDIRSQIISHAQEKFLKIMDLDNIRPQDLMDSLSIENNRNMVFKAG
jgi:hypothetical protein